MVGALQCLWVDLKKEERAAEFCQTLLPSFKQRFEMQERGGCSVPLCAWGIETPTAETVYWVLMLGACHQDQFHVLCWLSLVLSQPWGVSKLECVPHVSSSLQMGRAGQAGVLANLNTVGILWRWSRSPWIPRLSLPTWHIRSVILAKP